MGAQAVRLSNVDIDTALDNEGFEVRFQPIFDLGNGALARMETFVRWRHPSLGVLPPGAFISFFENQGRMSELTRFVLDASLKAYTEWRGPYAPGFSLNLALSDLGDEAFSSHFTKLLRDYQFPADLVTLECPMPPVDTDIAVAAAQFARLSETGARLAIEVRGRANDLLRNIDPFPFDEIKTGGSSILRFARTVRGPGLSAISDLLEIANNANAVITAVGVEDQTSLAALRGLGFTAAQGNHLGKVGDISDFMPSHVNDVRQLLGLEKLSPESLAALFRTDAPGPAASGLDAFSIEDEVSPDALIERLSNRFDQQKEVDVDLDQSEKTSSADSTKSIEAQTKTPDIEEERKSKAREKAKILAVAKREKAREVRKAAAIARAKSKTGARDESDSSSASSQEPRELQQRISDEFATRTVATDEACADIDFAAAISEATDPSHNQHTKKLSVPEKLAAVAKATEAPLAEQPIAPLRTPPTDPHESDPISTIRMPVGAVAAHFQPGVRVGGPPYHQEVRSPSIDAANARNTALQSSSTQSPQLDSGAKTEPTPPKNNIEDVPDQTNQLDTVVPPEAICEDALSQTDIEGDLFEAHAKEEPQHRNIRRKSFLKRTVLPYPTHFWPKSWAHRYRQLTASRAAHETPESTIQAAE